MAARPEGSHGGPIWPVFELSQVPMALIDRQQQFVAVNDAVVELFQYRREDLIGTRAGPSADAQDLSAWDERWERLLRTHELCGNRVVAHASGELMNVGYAAHPITIDGRWLALFVTLSAQLVLDGIQLIATTRPRTGVPAGTVLTPREREVIRRVATGANSRQIAADLYLSPATVRSHVRNAMYKTDTHTRAQLVAVVQPRA